MPFAKASAYHIEILQFNDIINKDVSLIKCYIVLLGLQTYLISQVIQGSLGLRVIIKGDKKGQTIVTR